MADRGLRAWVAAQAWRARMLARDGGRLVRGAVGTLAWALAPERPGACLASLEGEPVTRCGDDAVYRVRVHNAGSRAARLEVALHGRRTEGLPAEFGVRWTATVDPEASADWWVRSRWQGDAELLPGPPAVRPVRWLARPAGRWTVAAELRDPDGAERDRLVIGGIFTS